MNRSDRTMLDSGAARTLLIGGGIANFTDVTVTFGGIMDVLEESADEIRASEITILVRRGGPNYKQALQAMSDLGSDMRYVCTSMGPRCR